MTLRLSICRNELESCSSVMALINFVLTIPTNRTAIQFVIEWSGKCKILFLMDALGKMNEQFHEKKRVSMLNMPAKDFSSHFEIFFYYFSQKIGFFYFL